MLTERDEKVTMGVVGVDEIILADGKISVGSPVALALVDAHVDDKARIRTPRGPEVVEVVGIRHPEPHSSGWSACVPPG